MSHSSESQRRSTRLEGYDYSQSGGYFVTICTHRKACILGEISGGILLPTKLGKTVKTCWLGIPDHFPNTEMDEWVIMPNHIHGIILIHDASSGEAFAKNSDSINRTTANASPLRYPAGTTPRSLGAIIQNFKSISTRKANQLQGTPGRPIWQRGFYDRIIRNQSELDHIRKYITDNPLEWKLDPYHVQH